jgi:class 3 adenylate cyclase/tetratricopeptide (TPR) repeat protein
MLNKNGSASDLNIADWLAELGLGEHAPAFAQNGVVGALLADLTNDDLKDLGVSRLIDRKRILAAVVQLGDAPGAAGPAVIPASDAVRGERRQVTVLFADISGFTSLSAELGAERTHMLLDTYFRTVDEIVVSFGGTIDKHIGDSVMAVFGAPVAHDNDPERAARAALEVHAAMAATSEAGGHALKVHIGIASGQVVASGVGGDQHYTMTGDSVNLASRLTDAAGPSETLVSKTVFRAIEGRFEAEDCGSLSLKGIAEPVSAFRLKSRIRGRHRHSQRPLVGRQMELRQFEALLAACRNSGIGQAVLVRGEAGIGKTRLGEEVERLAGEAGFLCHRTLVLDFGVGKGQDAVRALIRGLLSIPQGSNKQCRIAAAARALDDEIVKPRQAVFLNDLLDLPQPPHLRPLFDAMDNHVRNTGSRETTATIVRQLSKRQPLFLIVEDVHWATAYILDHLAELTRVAGEHSVLLVITCRIEGDPIDQRWRASVSPTAITTLDLRPLRRDDALAMAAALFEAGNQFAATCVERAEGNPLFLEQLLRHAESSTAGVPDSVQSLVQARVDALPPADRQALHAASVLGQRFTQGALQQLVGHDAYSPDLLIERFFIRRQDEGFLFAHALIQEGIYNSLLEVQRTALHLRAADIFNQSDPALHAQHLDRAGDRRAAQAYLKAAASQSEVFRVEAALSLAKRGIELASEAQTLCDLHCLCGDLLKNIGDSEGCMAAYEQGGNFASDDDRRCRVLIGMAHAMRMSDRQTEALEVLTKAQQIAETNGHDHWLAGIHYLRGNCHFPLGNIDGCLDEHSLALAAARRSGSAEDEALALGGLGDAYYLQGHMQSAFEQFRSCIDLCQSKGFVRIDAANRHMMGWTRIHQMEFAKARADAASTVELARQISHRRAELLALMLHCMIDVCTGDYDDFEEAAVQALDLARRSKARHFEAQILENQARFLFGSQQIAQALAVIDQALQIVREVGMSFCGATVLVTKARIVADVEESRHLLQEAEAVLDAGCVAHNHMWFAQIAIEAELARRGFSEMLRHADRLTRYTQRQKLKWCDFTIERAHALAAFGEGDRSGPLRAKLQGLYSTAAEAGLRPALPALESALTAG